MVRSRRLWIGIIGLLLCVIVIASSGLIDLDREPHFLVQRARVLSVDDSLLSPDPFVDGLLIGRQTIEIEVLSGDHAGQRFRIVNTMSRFHNHHATENMELLVSIMEGEAGIVNHVDVFGHSRATFLYILIGLFLLILLVVGRKKGLYSAISLAFTLVMVVFFMIPLILRGHSPVFFAVITAGLTTVFTIFMVSDISLKSIAAIGGTLVGVASAGIVSILAGRFAHISGMQLEHAEELIFHAQQGMHIQIPSLLFAGVIIAALGAVMDVGMSISSAVFEIRQANPKMEMRKLYKSGMNIGGDIMGTMSNTLILAFAGTSITVIAIIALYQLPYLQLINLNLLAIEIVQGLSASIGLILTVPVTALLAALLASNNKITAFLRDKAKVKEKDGAE